MGKFSFDAVIFDLDGVITNTATVHANAWKKMFDDYLKYREEKYGEAFREFTYENDYLPQVDGKPRYEGVRSFLQSRNIDIPFGHPSDKEEMETCCGLGNRKNNYFHQILQQEGVEVFPSTVELIHELKKNDIRIGVASSSKNCQAVLQAAGIENLFETRVDGVVSAELGLSGKPSPDIFLRACENLKVDYKKAAIVEDAVSGVQAGANGNFGLVLGLARDHNALELAGNGADIVVKDISELEGTNTFEAWFSQGIESARWGLFYNEYNPGFEKSRETLLTVGNGFFATRGSMEETPLPSSINYPATYMTGVYNTLKSNVAGRTVENEDFVNCMDWVYTSFKIDEDEWIDINKTTIEKIQRYLNFKTGELSRKMIIRDKKGRRTLIHSRRSVSMANPYIGGLQYLVKPLNYKDKITIRTDLKGNIKNEGVPRYRALNQNHLQQISQGGSAREHFVVNKTTTSSIRISTFARVKPTGKVVKEKMNMGSGFASAEFRFSLEENQEAGIEKIVGIVNSVHIEKKEVLETAEENVLRYNSYENMMRESENAWKKIWELGDIQITGQRFYQRLLRLHLFHLYITASPLSGELDFAIPARGLHGEAYRGHIFWDELFIIPWYSYIFKNVAKASLVYRYNRLDEARKYAASLGYKGAMFPWQSGSSGKEETQVVHLNPVSGEWGEDYSSRQRHVSLAIAWNAFCYEDITGDTGYMHGKGAEMLFEICRFWASIAQKDKESGKYFISGIMGPDEFHEKYPGSTEGGLKNNAYTNIMTAWLFQKSIELYNSIPAQKKEKVAGKIQLTPEEIENWKTIAGNLKIGISEEGIIEQFEGYFNLKELDWEKYLAKYGEIHRLDRILKSEKDSPDDYKISKQADLLMTFYNLEPAEVDKLLKSMGYSLPNDYITRNFNYYFNRTSHGSTLSNIVHTRVAYLINNKKLAWELYQKALLSDFSDVQGGTTGEGIHTGMMGGTLMIALHDFAGIKASANQLSINPRLPDSLQKISLSINYKGNNYKLDISNNKVVIYLKKERKTGVKIKVGSNELTLKEKEKREVELND